MNNNREEYATFLLRTLIIVYEIQSKVINIVYVFGMCHYEYRIIEIAT